MEFSLQKAIYIATGITVALIIVSAVIFVFVEISNIYSTVDKVDVSILTIKDEFEIYQDNTMGGVEVLNTIKKYRNNKQHVNIRFNTAINGIYTVLDNDNNWNTVINNYNNINFEYTYSTKVIQVNDNKIQIDFTRIN